MMERYQLAKIVEWAGTLRTRKAMQKIVYLLQAQGCPIHADYVLHHFGPYSPDVAQLTDELVNLDLLEEGRERNRAGTQYNYTLTDYARKTLLAHESTEKGRAAAAEIEPFRPQVEQLANCDVKLLEIAATLVYFYRQKNEWQDALEATCRFKGLNVDDSLTRRAVELAQSIQGE